MAASVDASVDDFNDPYPDGASYVPGTIQGKIVQRKADPKAAFDEVQENATYLPKRPLPPVTPKMYVDALVDYLNINRSKQGKLTYENSKNVLMWMVKKGLDPESYMLDAWTDYDFFMILKLNKDFFTSTNSDIALKLYFRTFILPRQQKKIEEKLKAMEKKDLEDVLGKTFEQRQTNFVERYAAFIEKHKEGGKKRRTTKRKQASRRKKSAKRKSRTTRRRRFVSRKN